MICSKGTCSIKSETWNGTKYDVTTSIVDVKLNKSKRMLFTFSKNKHILTKKRNINYSTLLCCHRTIAPHRFCYLISEHGIKYVKNILCFIVSHCVKSQIIIHLSYCLYIIHIDMCKSSCLTTYLSMFKYKYFYTVDPSPLKKTTINM